MDTAQIRRLVTVYVQSIDEADAQLGATVWSTTPDVSFIEPLGEEQGWNEIASEFYGKQLAQTFTKRDLEMNGDVNVQIYGSAAVVQFRWRLNAVLRSTGKLIHMTGRESQVYVQLPDKGWRLVHVHYSTAHA